MNPNDNSVNMASASAAKQGYHHGNLKAALLDAGLALLEQRSLEEVHVREAARVVGVSATAVYRHFPDRHSFMNALAHIGAERLAAVMIRVSSDAGDGLAGLNAAGKAYVRFALDNPALFRLLSSRLPSADPFGHQLEAVSSPLRFIRGLVTDLLPTSAGEERRALLVLQTWSVVHGLAILLLDGQAPGAEKMIDQIIDAGRLLYPGEIGET